MAQRCTPAPFLSKTYQMVEDRSTDEVISWNENGKTFVVWKPADFARDLLPNYFKHNNFSSFVRQLNTYGFRKIVPERWEFANDFFKRGEKELLCEIHRRKAVTASAGGKSNGGETAGAGAGDGDGVVGGSSSPTNSGDDLGSTSNSSPDSKNQGSGETQLSDLSEENEKLKKDNEMLSSELAQTKRQCEELITYLSTYVKVGADEINRIMMQGSGGPSHDGLIDVNSDDVDDDEKEEEAEQEGKEDSLKLFGVWLKGNKRERNDDGLGLGGPPLKETKVLVDFDAPWMRIPSSLGETNKVCN